MFKIALVALFAMVDVEAKIKISHSLHHLSHSASHSFHKGSKAFEKWARSGVKSGYDVTPGNGVEHDVTKYTNCHSCVANLGSWSSTGSGSCSANSSYKDGDMDIEEWFNQEAGKCADTLGLCQAGNGKGAHAGWHETMVGTGVHATWADHNAYTIADKGNITLGWNTVSAGSTSVPLDYFCLFNLSLT